MNFYILNVDKDTENYIKDIHLAANEGKIKLGEIRLCEEDGVNYFANIIFEKEESDTDDQFIPSHAAPHVLAQVIVRLLELSGFSWRMVDFESKAETPYEQDLEIGLKAVSLSMDVCPLDCLEPRVCPGGIIEAKKDIDTRLKEFLKKQKRNVIPVNFICSHFIRSVSTIPVKSIIDGWLMIKNILASEKKVRLMISTYSRCHGISALIEVEKIN